MRFAVLALLLLATLGAYLDIADHAFAVLDDAGYVYANPHVTGGLTLKNVAWAFTTGAEANWHPLTWISLQLDVTCFGVAPGAMKLVNLAVHLTSTAGLALLLHRWTRAFGASLFVAGVFALHPLHVESVAWIAERKDVLSHVAFVLALHAWTSFVETKRRAHQLLALLAFALGLAAKPMLVTLPFLLLVLEPWPLARLRHPGFARGLRARLAELAPFFALALAASIVTYCVQRAGGAMPGLERAPVGARVANAVVAYARYLGRAFWPAELSVLHAFRTWSAIEVAGAAALLVALLAWAWSGRRAAPWRCAGLAWYFGTLVPVIGIVQVGFQSIANRYTYLPLTGAVMAVAFEVGERSRGRRAATRCVAGLAVIVLALLAWRTRVECAYWRDGVVLFERALAIEPDNVPARRALAHALEPAGRTEEARADLERAGGIVREMVEAALRRARECERANDLPGALATLRAAVQYMPRHVEARFALASLLARTGARDEALSELDRLVSGDGAHAPAHALVGRLRIERGEFDAAADAYAAAAGLLPGDARAARAALLSAAEAGRVDVVRASAPVLVEREAALEAEVRAAYSRAAARARARGDTARAEAIEAAVAAPLPASK
ncbi:MAG: tetratricopeptide repeat protein [Planctomycetes bacterium]|nr:tetratricopeptide repeat protein [Planctomycetota bacterium]